MSPRVAVTVLSLAAVPVGVGPVAADPDAAIRLVWFDPSELAWGSESIAHAEAAALLSRMGATVSWRRAAAPEEIPGGEVWIVLVGAVPQQTSAPLVLGATGRGPSVAPVVWVRVPNVRAALGISPSRSFVTLTPYERRLLGVALGRVIAHEVVHSRVPALGHGTGLMSGHLTRRQLTASSIAFEPGVAFALQAALRGDPVLASAGSGVMADAQALDKGR